MPTIAHILRQYGTTCNIIKQQRPITIGQRGPLMSSIRSLLIIIINDIPYVGLDIYWRVTETLQYRRELHLVIIKNLLFKNQFGWCNSLVFRAS